MRMEEIDFDSDAFEDILSRDDRYDARAYAFLLHVIHTLGQGCRHFSAQDILHEFKELALDQYGPMAYTVLSEWGLSRTEDIGDMMFNLVEAHRIGKEEDDRVEDFACGYDFKEVFLGPYEA